MLKPEKIRYGVFTSNKDFAKRMIDNLIRNHKGKVENYRNTKNELSYYMDDGTNFIWLDTKESIRGFRCSKAIVDISTCSLEFIQMIIKPICIYADKDDFEIVASEDNIEYGLFQFINQLNKIACIKGDIPIYYNDYDCPTNYNLGFSIEKNGLNLYGY